MAKKKDASKGAPKDEGNDADGEDSGDDGDKKKGKKKDEGAEQPSARAAYIGLGLVGSLVVGFEPLRDAFQGNGSFENAILRFLACAAVCVVGAGTIGRMIDASGPGTEAANRNGVELAADSNPILGRAPGTEVLGQGGPGGNDKNETIAVGSASSADSVRKDTEQKPQTSSEETS